MTRKRYTEEQIIAVLKDAQAGIGVPELCRKHGILDATFYKWRAKYGGLAVSEVKTLRHLKAWRIDDTHRRPHRSLGHLTPSEFVTHRQTLRIAEAVACSGYDLSRKGTNITCILTAEFPTILWCVGQSWQKWLATTTSSGG